MKKFFILSLVFCFAFDSFGQVSNLVVNGISDSLIIASGDVISWSYDVPNPGDTTLLDFWIDANNNKELDSSDIQWTYFMQIDGDPNGHNGPPDMDGSVNGKVSFQQKVGLAPGNYILTFKNNDSVIAIPGTVTPLVTATFTISGHINVPAGLSKKNIVMQLESGADGGPFWDAITDSSGNFSILMDADTTGNPWKLSVNNGVNFKGATISPSDIKITLDSSIAKEYTNNEFTIALAAASISGMVKDENGNPVINANVYINNSNMSFENYVNSDFEGNYYIGLSPNNLPLTNLNVGSWVDSGYVQFNYSLPSINAGNNIIHDIYLLKINSKIMGRITFNGNDPGMINVFASCADTGFIRTTTNNNGYFEFKVSDKINNYTISIGQVPQGYVNDSIVVQPGDTTANLNLKALTDVNESKLNVPKDYSLFQNYPNPFNPTTVIKYQIPKSGFVSLKVYDILGNEVGTLVNENRNAGSYKVGFDGSNLSSGIYFYQIKTGSYTAVKKFMLLK
jgi:hypothetical protein